MAWNESGNGKDPWKRDGDEPNDLDQIVQDWQRRFGSLMGGRYYFESSVQVELSSSLS